MGAVIAFPDTPVARIRRSIGLCRDHAALDRCGADFRRIRGSLSPDEQMEFAKAFAVAHFQIGMAKLGGEQ